jgi:UDP-2-acetamido-3-amino-2,3-dideoxy-glucuronate N-acetyltransferase
MGAREPNTSPAAPVASQPGGPALQPPRCHSAADAPGLLLGDRVHVGDRVTFGAYVVVHDGTVIADGCSIEDHVVLGKRPRLARHSSAHGAVGALSLGPRVSVGTGAVVFAGAEIGPGAIIGDQAFIRERSTIGACSVIGRGSVVDNDVEIGARVRVQSGVYITAFSRIEDDVFLGPGVITTNDNTMARHAPAAATPGVILRRACRVGGEVVLTPGVEIGEEAFIAAGAVVTRDIPSRAVAVGVPARVVREVSAEDLLELWR